MHPAFANLRGQTQATEFLSRAIAADRLPHGMIFAGPAGVGRNTTANALASIFLADKPDDESSRAATLRQVQAQTHPDFHFVTRTLVRQIEGKSANKAIDLSVDVIREHVVAAAGKKSTLGRGKVFVIDEAETMNAQAQNALLKTLEEPPGRTLILLLTDQPHALLSTIRSRAQLVRFQPLPEADALAILAAHGIDGTIAQNAVRFAGGSPGLAIRWQNDGVILGATTLRKLLDGGGVGADPQRGASDLAAFLKQASEDYAKKQLERDPVGSEDGFKRDGLTVYLRLAADILRHKLPASPSLDTVDLLATKIESIRRAESYIDGNVNTSLVLQQISGELARA